MARIPLQDRLAMLDANIGHWTQADAENGTPIEIVPGFGLAQLTPLRDEYEAKHLEIMQLESDLLQARADRDAVFGQDADDDNGAWFRLKQYKAFVRARLGARHPLARTVPNLGTIRANRHLTILQRFIDHWERVNALLDPDLTLGPFALADLQTARDTLSGLIQQIEQLDQVELPLAREQREQLFGDEEEDKREETSIVARLVLYQATIEAMFPNKPLADSLPEIFPGSGGGTTPLPTFRFNWAVQPDLSLKTWIETPDVGDALEIMLREGAFSETQAFGTATPGQVVPFFWQNVTVVDDLDQMELQNTDGTTVATGVFDATLAEPV